uniref:Zinc finger protein n=1 Tax=Ciona intestinalis TaxID=7719 RepID=F7A9G9_CIOIN
MTSELQSAQNTLFQRVRVGQAKSAEVFGHVNKILRNSSSLTSRYFKVNVVKFLQDNCQGARDILNLMGYTTPVRDGLSFPNHVIEPDINNVVMVTSDIILLKFELLLIDNVNVIPSCKSKFTKHEKYNGYCATEKHWFVNIVNKQAELHCKTCDNKQCKQCDKIWHQCSNRLDHVRIEVTRQSLALHGVSTTVYQHTQQPYQHFPSNYPQNPPNNQLAQISIATPPPSSRYTPHDILQNNENSSSLFHEVRGPPEICYMPDSFDKLLPPSGPNSTEPKHLNNSQTDNFAAKVENRQPDSEIQTHYQCEETSGQESDNFSLPDLHDVSYTQDIEVFTTYDQVISCVDIEPSSMNVRELEQQTKKEDIRLNCLLMVGNLREAEREGFSPKQVEIAIKQLKTSSNNNMMGNPVQWLKDNWMNKVVSLTAQHPLFNVEEVSDLLVESEFDENELNAKLKLRKLAKIEAVNTSGEYLVDDYERYLLDHHGDVNQTIRELQQQLLQSIHRRLRDIEENETKITDFIQITEETRAKNALASYFLCDNDIILSMIYRILHSNITKVEDYLNECNIDDLMEAARSFPDDYEAAVKFLGNECKICFKNFPKSKIECMPTCTDIECKYCRGCLHEYLRHKINETPRYVRHIVCPVCLQPDMDEDGESVENYLNHLDALIRRGLDDATYQLFQKKLRDQTLMKMPNFRWCAHCVNGFLYEQQENNLKMVCSACGKATCYDCKKPWEDQHEGISCNEFQQWKEMNDPDSQAAGLAAHLKEHGIDCPNCKFRYALSKGGCIHFKCSTCSFEFCRGCKGSFKQGRRCTLFRTCQNKGLHAHHPRDCLFYLRDLEIERLQKILQDGGIPHRTECTISNNTCQVMEQQETPDGLIDACCGGEVHENNADLCEVHYKEYLVILINKNHLDPATVFTGDELETCLHREEHPMPHKQDMNDEQYHEKLLSIVCTYPLIHTKLQMQQ